jgi:hypothetical protein
MQLAGHKLSAFLPEGLKQEALSIVTALQRAATHELLASAGKAGSGGECARAAGTSNTSDGASMLSGDQGGDCDGDQGVPEQEAAVEEAAAEAMLATTAGQDGGQGSVGDDQKLLKNKQEVAHYRAAWMRMYRSLRGFLHNVSCVSGSRCISYDHDHI